MPQAQQQDPWEQAAQPPAQPGIQEQDPWEKAAQPAPTQTPVADPWEQAAAPAQKSVEGALTQIVGGGVPDVGAGTRAGLEDVVTKVVGGADLGDIGKAVLGAGLGAAGDIMSAKVGPEIPGTAKARDIATGHRLPWEPPIGGGPSELEVLFGELKDAFGKAGERARSFARSGLNEQLGGQSPLQPLPPATTAATPATPTTAPTAEPAQPPRQDAKPGPYTTQLSSGEEQQFQNWVKQNKIPWQDSPTADYDMRGFWKAMTSGDPEAQRNAQTGHFPDTYKTPYHDSFSNESKYATKDAPIWRGNNQLVNKQGRVVFDESVEPIIRQAAADTGLPAKLIRSVITQESNFKADALGQPTKTGERAQGMMQLMPETIRQMKVKDPFNAEENIRAGARWLKMKIDAQGGDIRKGVKAYYGTGKPKTGPDPEDYTTQVMSRYGSQ